MYGIFPKGDWSPDKPNSDDDLWRYIDFAQFISILENRALWFSPLSGFFDPFEGALPQSSLESLTANISNAIGEPKLIVSRMYDALRHTTYVSCWHQRETETAAMWQLYKNSGKEIAIKTTVGDLSSALLGDPDIIAGCVNYIPYDRADEFAVTRISPSFHKRPSFEHESEYRLVISNFEVADGAVIDDKYADKVAEESRDGIPVSIDPDNLIKEVVVSPIAGGWLESLASSVTSNYISDEIEVYQSDLLEDPF